jgi:hypothetical protein
MTWRRLRTEDLIDRLAADLRPRHVESRIRSRRLWAVAILAIVMPTLLFEKPLRADLASRLADGMFLTSIATSAMIFVTGLLALLILRISPLSRSWLLLPLIALGLWLVSEFASIGLDLSREGWRAFAFETSPQCPLVIGIVGIPIFFAILGLSRIGLILWRGPIITVAALSAFSLPATMLNLFHGLDTGAMVLLWHFGAIAVFSVAAAFLLNRRIPRIVCDWLAL